MVAVANYRRQFPLEAPHQEVRAECSGMDIYTPFTDLDRPVIGVAMYVHGGSWTGGDRRSDPLFPALGAGLLANGWAVASIDYRFGQWPVQLEDARCAVEYLRSRFHRIVAIGGSAGGQIALMLAVEDRSVAAAVSLAGPVDLAQWPEVFPDPNAADPRTWLDPDDPPTLVVMGDRDRYTALSDVAPFRTMVVRGAGHDLIGDPAAYRIVGEVVDFLDD